MIDPTLYVQAKTANLSGFSLTATTPSTNPDGGICQLSVPQFSSITAEAMSPIITVGSMVEQNDALAALQAQLTALQLQITNAQTLIADMTTALAAYIAPVQP